MAEPDDKACCGGYTKPCMIAAVCSTFTVLPAHKSNRMPEPVCRLSSSDLVMSSRYASQPVPISGRLMLLAAGAEGNKVRP